MGHGLTDDAGGDRRWSGPEIFRARSAGLHGGSPTCGDDEPTQRIRIIEIGPSSCALTLAAIIASAADCFLTSSANLHIRPLMLSVVTRNSEPR